MIRIRRTRCAENVRAENVRAENLRAKPFRTEDPVGRDRPEDEGPGNHQARPRPRAPGLIGPILLGLLLLAAMMR